MKNANINFTQDEAQALVNLINIAVKAVGLEDKGVTAKNGVFLVDKIMNAFPVEPPKETPKEERDKVFKISKKK